jgi:chromosomal replication initiation ATPase DnaA
MEQKYFNYNLKTHLSIDDYFIGDSNRDSYNHLMNNNFSKNFFLNGPNKSGKSHLGSIWKKKFHAISYNNNLNQILGKKLNVLVDNFFQNTNEEDIFHIINHCNLNNLNILIISNISLLDNQFELKDLSSRLKTFINIKINLPDDQLLMNLMIKLFNDKQIIVKNPEIFNYILKRVDRSYEKVFILIDKIDKILFEKNKQLTIPLIKELI